MTADGERGRCVARRYRREHRQSAEHPCRRSPRRLPALRPTGAAWRAPQPLPARRRRGRSPVRPDPPFRKLDDTGGWTALNNNNLKIVTNGYAKAAPALTSATIDGAALALNFDKDLDTTSVPAASRFMIAAVGSSYAATGITVSTRQVRLTVPDVVLAGQFVTVSYSKPGSNPLKGSNGAEVAAFSGKVVTNNTKPKSPPPDTPGTGQPRAPIIYTEDGVTSRGHSVLRRT